MLQSACLRTVRRHVIPLSTRLKLQRRCIHPIVLKSSEAAVGSEKATESKDGQNTGETVVSSDMARMLMRKGFSAIPKCTFFYSSG